VESAEKTIPTAQVNKTLDKRLAEKVKKRLIFTLHVNESFVVKNLRMKLYVSCSE
jgi:hypothetical protein